MDHIIGGRMEHEEGSLPNPRAHGGTSEALASNTQATNFRVCYFACLNGVSKSVQVLYKGTEAVMVLTLTILK